VVVRASKKMCSDPKLDRGRLASYVRSERNFGVASPNQ
jgi:hypothetical protein